ncbi:P-loop NTPase fold protein [Pantoea rwandensis]|uniref:P-loop NTPase fold protein n=1 Tax=Pantoea rwandensis TaxID=1076550 RepID=UPI001FEABD45|nr:P-loop NTPase fold protein [Pantoea rwandensis]
MALILQQETPSDSDLFKGESHRNVADKMAEVIKDQDINILGLEGELGSGKSTIIHFLKKKLTPDYTFINFDAELYHYGNTKKALIEVIYNGISVIPGVNKAKLEMLRNKALGNIVEYDKKVSSRLSWWTVSFILLSLLSVQMVRYLLLDLNAYLKPGSTIVKPVLLLEFLALLSPGMLLLWLKYKSRQKNRKLGSVEDVISVGDLFKQNSVDKISETWLISREIGTIELTNALTGFTESSTVPSGAKFILIIDNLDRIGADKVKELWSDMELIAGTTHKQFRIIVPYSARHVAKSLLVEGHTGREFIAKRIPVTFTVPPLITAGWQDAFRVMWKETVCNNKADFSCEETMLILERWRPGEYPRITPRLLKKLVNDLYILQKTVPVSAPEEYVLLALYVIFVRYNESDVTTLLRFSDGENANMQLTEYEDKVLATQKQLNRIFLNETRRWSEYLMSIHFQAPVELALSELLDMPLTDAVKNKDFASIEKLLVLYGFSHAWQRCAHRMSIKDWLETIVKLPDSSINKISPEIQSSVRALNASYALTEREPFRQNFSLSLSKLIKEMHIGLEDFINRQTDFIIRDLSRLQSTPQNDETYVNELLAEADIYSGFLGYSLLNKITRDLSGEVYSLYLLNRHKQFSNLEIPSLSLIEEEKEKMLRFELGDEGSDIFNDEIIRFFGLASASVNKLVENKENNLPESVSGAYRELLGNTQITEKIKFRKLIFNKEWYAKGLIQRIPYQRAIQEEYPEEFAAQIVAHMVAIDDYTGIESFAQEYAENDDFIKYLASYFRYMTSFHTVLKSLSNETAAPYVKPAIADIILNDHLDAIQTLSYAGSFYPEIAKLPGKINLLKPLIDREEKFCERIREENLESLDSQFIDDVFSTNSLPLVMDKIIILSQSCFTDKESLYAAIVLLGDNRKIILSRMASSDRFVAARNAAPWFAEWYRSADVSDPSHGKKRPVLVVCFACRSAGRNFAGTS